MISKFKAITKGYRIIDQIFRELLIILKTQKGLTELKLAHYIRRQAKQLGAQDMAFPPIVAFGKGSGQVHHFPTNARIAKNNFLMLDYGVKINGYCSYFTRTLFLGRPKTIHEKIYNIVLKSQLAAIKKIVPGTFSDQIDFAARHIINRSGFGPYFTHGTGHGVGKKIHEPPSFKTNTNDKLTRNLIVTVEPGIYLPNKFGVRIEDMVLVLNQPKVFSKIPKDFPSIIIKA